MSFFDVLCRIAPVRWTSQRDFVRMGRGIGARYERCVAWWRPHLELSKNFVVRASTPVSRVAVLGAGRLLDVDLHALLRNADEVHLFDADPGCLASWRPFEREYSSRVIAHIEDLTGALDEWTSQLGTRAARADLAGVLDRLRFREPAWTDASFDGIISLNTLGQIPLYWRDRVLGRFPRLTQEASRALALSMGRLQEQHLAAVATAGRWSVILTDREYLYYDCAAELWRTEPALFGAAPCSFEERYPRTSPQVTRATWWWHVVPQYVEDDDEGCIHVVEARARFYE